MKKLLLVTVLLMAAVTGFSVEIKNTSSFCLGLGLSGFTFDDDDSETYRMEDYNYLDVQDLLLFDDGFALKGRISFGTGKDTFLEEDGWLSWYSELGAGFNFFNDYDEHDLVVSGILTCIQHYKTVQDIDIAMNVFGIGLSLDYIYNINESFGITAGASASIALNGFYSVDNNDTKLKTGTPAVNSRFGFCWSY